MSNFPLIVGCCIASVIATTTAYTYFGTAAGVVFALGAVVLAIEDLTRGRR